MLTRIFFPTLQVVVVVLHFFTKFEQNALCLEKLQLDYPIDMENNKVSPCGETNPADYVFLLLSDIIKTQVIV